MLVHIHVKKAKKRNMEEGVVLELVRSAESKIPELVFSLTSSTANIRDVDLG